MTDAAPPVLSAHQVAVGFGDTPVLTKVDLTLQPQGLVAIVGPSGVGKSTLLRALAGLLPTLEGYVERPAQASPQARDSAMVFQSPRLLPWRRVLGNVELGLESLEIPRAERRERARYHLERVGLGDYTGRWPYSLSGGQQQRVGLARAMAVEPRVLFMDEPFSALDAITRGRLQRSLITLRQETTAAIVFVTHDIEEATLLSDRIMVLGHYGDNHPAGVHTMVEVPLPGNDRRNHPDFRPIVESIERLMGDGPGSDIPRKRNTKHD